MIKFNRADIQDKYYILEIYNCPTDVIMFAANLGAENITIENYKHHGKDHSPLFLSIPCDNQTVIPKPKRYDMDFEITKSDFNNLKSIWHSNGCYAIFHEITDLRFKATDLNDIARYKALDNFKWTLELAIPGSASDGWGRITSPDKTIIEKIENYIKTIYTSSCH
ncbi:MAG: hypothetical protein HY064_16620 [Bacteroidetes bacterium]|nr:hypothetical protein [Bacteroidota bacterium]